MEVMIPRRGRFAEETSRAKVLLNIRTLCTPVTNLRYNVVTMLYTAGTTECKGLISLIIEESDLLLIHKFRVLPKRSEARRVPDLLSQLRNTKTDSRNDSGAGKYSGSEITSSNTETGNILYICKEGIPVQSVSVDFKGKFNTSSLLYRDRYSPF